MKKVVIVTNKMVMGGIEKSLLELLKRLILDYQVTLIVNDIGGELFGSIPECVNIHKMNCDSSYSMFKNKKGIINKLKFLINYLKLRLTKSFYNECEIYTKLYSICNNRYDIAIAYSTPVSLANYYVINNINATKKILFIHNDLNKISLSPKPCQCLYQQFDNIVAVSNHARSVFIEYFPQLKDKTCVFYNLIDYQEIIKQSMEKISRSKEKFIICTVGRLEEEKGQDIIPDIIYQLKKRKIDVIWYLIGDGNLRHIIENKAQLLGVLDNIIFFGTQNNPYKFIRNCDIYVQTSRQEGFGITLLEAKILNKIVISTNFPCAYEHIKHGVDGFVINFDYNEIANYLELLFHNDNLRKNIVSNLEKNKYIEDMNVIYNLLS